MLPAQCATAIASQFEDPLLPGAIRAYFRKLYATRGDTFFDSATLEGVRFPTLGRIAAAGREGRFDFDSIARAFRMIDNDEPAVIAPLVRGQRMGKPRRVWGDGRRWSIP